MLALPPVVVIKVVFTDSLLLNLICVLVNLTFTVLSSEFTLAIIPSAVVSTPIILFPFENPVILSNVKIIS